MTLEETIECRHSDFIEFLKFCVLTGIILVLGGSEALWENYQNDGCMAGFDKFAYPFLVAAAQFGIPYCTGEVQIKRMQRTSDRWHIVHSEENWHTWGDAMEDFLLIAAMRNFRTQYQ